MYMECLSFFNTNLLSLTFHYFLILLYLLLVFFWCYGPNIVFNLKEREMNYVTHFLRAELLNNNLRRNATIGISRNAFSRIQRVQMSGYRKYPVRSSDNLVKLSNVNQIRAFKIS